MSWVTQIVRRCIDLSVFLNAKEVFSKGRTAARLFANILKTTELKFHTMQLQLIQKKIYEIRGLKVMLDFDLAVLYET